MRHVLIAVTSLSRIAAPSAGVAPRDCGRN